MLVDLLLSQLGWRYAATPDDMPRELADFDDCLDHIPDTLFRVALLIPMCGSAGLWAPSCISSAQIAVAEVNKAGGIRGRNVQLLMIDSALEAETPVENVINALIERQAIDAIVGMHISKVRQDLSKIVRQRIPYVYTPLYEGGETTKGIFAIGDTPDRQLGPALEFFDVSHGIKRWALVGNDYVWPHASHDFAKLKLQQLGGAVAFEKYVPFGLNDMNDIITELEKTQADGVLMSFVGQDAVTFNRAFGRSKLHERMIRFSCAIEENGLLASGAENLRGLYSASSYFASLQTPANASFKERYYAFHGETAPVLNALGQSTYEGVQFLAGLMERHQADWPAMTGTNPQQMCYTSVRRDAHSHESAVRSPIYLAKAKGVVFEVLTKL